MDSHIRKSILQLPPNSLIARREITETPCISVFDNEDIKKNVQEGNLGHFFNISLIESLSQKWLMPN